MLTWRTELEHGEVRAEAALVTILSLTQVTELKLLIDCGPDSHRFYAFVMSLLICAILLEAMVGAVVIYIGGINRSRPPRSAGCTDDDDDIMMTSSRYREISPWHFLTSFYCQCCCCCCRTRNASRANNRRRTPLRDYKTQETLACSSSGVTQELLQSPTSRTNADTDRPVTPSTGCCPTWYSTAAKDVSIAATTAATTTAGGPAGTSIQMISLNALSTEYTVQQSSAIRLADIEYQLSKVRGRVDSLESSVKRGLAASNDLDAARKELAAISRMRDDAETNRKLAEMRHRREKAMTELQETHRQARLFVRVASWQNVVTYLTYAIMLLNVVITTFGMSGDKGGPVLLYSHHHLPR